MTEKESMRKCNGKGSGCKGCFHYQEDKYCYYSRIVKKWENIKKVSKTDETDE